MKYFFSFFYLPVFLLLVASCASKKQSISTNTTESIEVEININEEANTKEITISKINNGEFEIIKWIGETNQEPPAEIKMYLKEHQSTDKKVQTKSEKSMIFIDEDRNSQSIENSPSTSREVKEIKIYKLENAQSWTEKTKIIEEDDEDIDIEDVEKSVRKEEKQSATFSKEVKISKDVEKNTKEVMITTNTNGEIEVKRWTGKLDEEYPADIKSLIEEKEKMDGHKIVRKRIESDEKERTGNMEQEEESFFEVEVEDTLVDVEPFPKTKVHLGVHIDQNLEIISVDPNTSAERADIRKGDIIKKMDAQVIYSLIGLMEHLSSYSPGNQTEIQIERDGEMIKKMLELEEK